MKENYSESSRQSLRERALKQVSTSAVDLSDLTPEEVLKIAHDLQVHQVELELQNEELRAMSSELENARNLFFTLFNYSPVGYVLLDSKGFIQEANLVFCQMAGSQPDQVIQKPIQQFLHDEDQAVLLGRLQAIFRSQEEKKLEVRLKYKLHDRNRWISVQTRKLHVPDLRGADQEQPVERLLLAFTDITERKEAEVALQNLLDEYQVLFNSVQDAVFLIEVLGQGEFRYLRTNTAHQRKTGISLEMIRGKTPVELLGVELGEIVKSNYQRCLEAGSPITYEETLDLPGGVRTWLTTLSPVWEQGSIKYLVGAAHDITEQKTFQKALQESEARLRALFENMEEGFALHEMIWDEEGNPKDYRFLEVNPAFERLVGLKAEQILNKTVLELLPTLERTWIERYGLVALTGESATFQEYSTPLAKWFEVHAFSPRRGHFATLFSDITERKRWEAEREDLIQNLQRKNTELEQFTYTVSHDLKSPLITVLGFIGFVEQSLEQGDLVQAQKDLQRIRFAAEKMQSLLDSLLELSRIGRLISSPSEFPFGDVILEAVQILMGRIRDQKYQVEFQIAENFPAVLGERERLLQVMQNLLENALKYMGDQTNPKIEIGWEEHVNEYHFYVRDNGIGIQPAYQQKIFGLFEKLDPNTKGYGVGLALVRRIIEVHGGRVWVQSEGLGAGSTFWFSLPKKSPYSRQESL